MVVRGVTTALVAAGVLAAGCGRVGFDPAGADGAHGTIDGPPGGVDSAGVIARWLMMADYDDPAGGLEVFAMDPGTGGLMPTGQGVVTSAASPSYFAVTPDGKYVYVPHEDAAASEVSGFAIDPRTGYLTELAGSPFPGAGTTNQIAVLDPTGAALFVSGAGGIQCYAVASDGGIAKVGAPVVVTNAFMMAMDPRGRFLYSATYLGATVYGFRVDAAACALTALGPLFASGDGMHALAIDPGGDYLLALTTSNSTTNVLAIDPASGSLEPLGTYPGGGRWAQFTHGGDRVLLADANSGLWSFAFDSATGAMDPAPGAPFATGPFRWFVLPDPAGAYAYASDRTSLLGFTIDADGSLVAMSGLPTPQVNPMAMGFITTTY